jgi:predicted unusual protein kinase regulating ubiquinone biosynthesis (AarF/ABC1/UbiB family)
VRALLEDELGAPLGELFQSFDETPFASASIGQVHRATMPDGTQVAVKVQHTGIRDAVESDLSNAGLLETVVGTMGGKRFDSKALLETIKARFREELDYELEAQRVTAFAELHRGDPLIRVPRLIPSRCSRSVLSTELVTGMTFDEICALPENEREAWARTLWRFVFKGNLVLGMFNADPHPGNYIFHPDGAVTFLDYGCVQSIPKERKQHARAMHRAAIDGDNESFAIHLKQMIGAKPGPLADMAVEYTRECFAPLFNAPYRITRSYAANLVEGMKGMAVVAKDLPQEQFFTMPKEMLFMNRLQFGFYSVLARLDVAVDYAEVERAILSEPDDATA